MKSAVAISVLAPAGSAMAAFSVIPSGISTGCSTFPNKLDSDSTLPQCTTMLNTATKAFASGGGSSSDLQPALTSLCGGDVSTACSDVSLRTVLTQFYQACTPELTSAANDRVKLLYDTLYTLAPLRNAACSKDDSGNYCGGSKSNAVAEAAQTVLGTTQDGVTIPNAATFMVPEYANVRPSQ
jgi:hypothetical protein